MNAGDDRSTRADAAVAKIMRLSWLSTGLVVVAVIAFAALVGSGWSWPYFIWGVVAGAFAVVYMRAMMQVAYRVIPASQEEIARAKMRSRTRWRGFDSMTVVFGGSVGALAASMQSAWPDVVFTAFVVLSQVPALIMLPRLRPRALASGDNSNRTDETH